jgi:hypothetical protein
MKKNLIYLVAGGVAVYLVVRAMRKKDDEANFSGNPFLYATGNGAKGFDPCGCYGSKMTGSRGKAQYTLGDGSVFCENSSGYAYVCNQSGGRVL